MEVFEEMLVITTKTINDYTDSRTSKGVSAILTAITSLRNDNKLLHSKIDSHMADNNHLRTQLEKENHLLPSDFQKELTLLCDQLQQAYTQQIQAIWAHTKVLEDLTTLIGRTVTPIPQPPIASA